MIVQDHFDCGVCGIGGVEKLEKFNEFAAAMAIPDEAMNLPGEQINTGQETNRAMAFIFVIAREGRMRAGLGWQVWCRVGDRLNAGLSSYEMMATPSLGFCLAAAAFSLMSLTSR
jgi:hypothetical protein